MKEYLLSIGFEQRLPWQFHNDHYQVTQLEEDSWGFDMWSITSKRYDSTSFRGRIRSVLEFKLIFKLVKEDYSLTEGEIADLKSYTN